MKKVVIFNSDSCSFCREAEAYMKENGIEYEDKNIKVPEFKKELMSLGFRSVPLIQIDGESILGFDRELIEEKLKD
jgi:glutaredoxin 3